MNEFSIINRFFINSENQKILSVEKGIGDDAAVFSIPANHSLVSTIDTLVEGVHFPVDTQAEDIAFKSLAVSLSDLASMGALPNSFTLSVTLPEFSETWLQGFSEGLFRLANQEQIKLIGGDTSKGPTSITIQANGLLEGKTYLGRDGAKVKDLVFVSGSLGLGALGLKVWQNSKEEYKKYPESIERFFRPIPRTSLGQKLIKYGASACIDVSDGFLADLKHICQASGTGANIRWHRKFVHEEFSALQEQEALNLILSGGDDYELCFTLPPEKVDIVKQIESELGIGISLFGEICEGNDVRVFDEEGNSIHLAQDGFKHF